MPHSYCMRGRGQSLISFDETYMSSLTLPSLTYVGGSNNGSEQGWYLQNQKQGK